MRGCKGNWRTKKLTYKFATVKAIVYFYLRYREHPVKRTEQVVGWSKCRGEYIGIEVSDRMVREALNELVEQGLCDREGSNYQLYWWSKERLV